MKYVIYQTNEFKEWLQTQPQKSLFQIYERFEKIKTEGYFGNHRYLGEIWELKWENGRRIYYAHFAHLNIVILSGGFKNDQKKDIRYAKKIYKNYTLDTPHT